MDFDTVPDKSGIRWVKGHHVFDGDHMIVRSAVKKEKLYDYDTWRDMENRVSDKYEMSDYDSYKDYNNAIKKELGVVANKHIKKYIDTTNKLLNKYKDVVQQSLRKPSKETSAWWNEVLIYKTKVIDAFVLRRVWDDYYFKNDSYDTTAYKKDLLKIVPENKITIGTPAQFRKWYTKREGEITI